MRYNTIPKEKVEQIFILHASGISMRRIKEEIGVSLVTIRRYLKSIGITTPTRKSKTLTKQDEADICALIVGRTRPTIIAKKYGIRYTRVLTIAKKHGLVVYHGEPPQEDIDEICLMYRVGTPVGRIARIMKYSYTMVFNVLVKAGLKTKR